VVSHAFWTSYAPSTSMRLMNHVLCTFISKLIVVYFDDFLIYNKILNEHVEHLCHVLNVGFPEYHTHNKN
jgi:hypothetical protein